MGPLTLIARPGDAAGESRIGGKAAALCRLSASPFADMIPPWFALTKEAFERYGADAVTLSPFMGFDSITPYLKYEGKGAFLLCRTSNPGGDDLQAQVLASVPGQPSLFEHVARQAQGPWNTNGQLGLVVGATRPHEIERVRAVAPTLPLLIPGVGAQGGDAVATVQAAQLGGGPIIINSSRAVLYASSREDFAAAARQAALQTRDTLNQAARAM